MLFSRAAVLVGIEATPGVAVAVTPQNDAILVDEPDYKASPQVIERAFARPDLSPFPFMIGRQLGEITFKHEARGNGLATGLTADAPKLARLFRACGFQLLPCGTAAERVSPVFNDVGNVGVATWVAGGAPVNDQPAMFTLVCTTAGAAAAAKFTVSANNPAVQAAPVADVAASAAMALGDTGVTVTPTSTKDFAVGDTFRVVVLPEGVKLLPVTTGYETATIEAYYDGLKHKLTGSLGTFSFTADAGGVVTVSFTFQGVHTPVVDSPFPAGLNFETPLPPLFTDALVTWGSSTALVIAAVTFDLGATHNPRDDANAPAGYRGYQLTDRQPKGGFTPEATLEAQNAFWGDFESAEQKFFMARVGTQTGNQMVMFGPRLQTSALGYKNQNNNRAYDVGTKFARFAGDDEVCFFFG